MRPANSTARDRLRQLLAAGPASTGELVSALQVSAPTVHRMLGELRADIASSGSTRRRKHALRRTPRGAPAEVPVFAVGETGTLAPAGHIAFVRPAGCLAQLTPEWPVPEGHDGWWGGLPYPVYDMRPQGYLGRGIARAVAARLQVSDNPEHWSDDDIVAYLAQYGTDAPGNLVVGEQAMQGLARSMAAGPGRDVIEEDEVPQRYVQLANASLGAGDAGSSAGGEFPKFTAQRRLQGARTPHVIVTFSGSDDSPAVRRWSDLLVCEHLALQVLAAQPGHAAAPSRIVQHGGRTFLESERFDRHGDFGRSPVVSLAALEAALIGSGQHQWPQAVAAPGAQGLFTPELVARVEELHWFGRFIANADMHHGNLGLRPAGAHFTLAPAYDMLPMMYAPLRAGEVPQREFGVEGLPLPVKGAEGRWRRMLDAAVQFWTTAAHDARVSAAFRATCEANAQVLGQWGAAWGEQRRRDNRPRLA